MPEQPISAAQLKRLQTLWGLEWRRRCGTAKLPELARDAESSRIVRITWAMGLLDRRVESFKELTAREAATLLDEIQKNIPKDLIRKTARPDRRTAQSYGTAGRRGTPQSKEIVLPTAQSWAKLDAVLRSLGWDQQRLAAFLRARTGPLRGREKIYSLADLNKVLWALEGIERRQKKLSADSADKNIKILKCRNSPLVTDHSPLEPEEVAAT